MTTWKSSGRDISLCSTNCLLTDKRNNRQFSELPFASVSKRVYVRNNSYENEFHLHIHFHGNQTHIHLNGFARRLVLKQRQRATRKWPIQRRRSILERGGKARRTPSQAPFPLPGGSAFPYLHFPKCLLRQCS